MKNKLPGYESPGSFLLSETLFSVLSLYYSLTVLTYWFLYSWANYRARWLFFFQITPGRAAGRQHPWITLLPVSYRFT